jgi:hypothetical protein
MSTPPIIPSSVLMWPITAKGAINRHNPLGDPTIEKYYHKALEDGRWLERNIAEANHWLLQKQQLVLAKIKTYTDMNKLAVDGQLKRNPRKFKYIADSLAFLQEVNQFQKDVVALVQATTQNIALLAAMEQNLLKMVQSVLNSLALLLNQVCNWNLPKLPSLPNLLPDGMFNWNGFNFSSLAAFAALKPNLNFNANFSFSQCSLGLPNLGNPAANPPASITGYSGNTLGTQQIVPPLDGTVPPAGQSLTDPLYVAQMQSTTTPVYGPAFNPNSSMIGAVPDPSTIISDYQMPAQTYQSNIVSIVPSLTGNTVEPGDADYSNPNLLVRQPNLQKDLIHYINLDSVVSSGFDPYVTSAWLFYIDICRNGRAGNWLPQYQNAFTTYIQPSMASLAANAVPWNNVLGGTGVSDTPKDIPFTDTLKAMPTAQQQLTLWKLSYVEAALLGYTRSKTWDAYQDANYLSGTTGSDLDYKPTSVNYASTTTATLGTGTAEYPTPCTYPTAIAAIFNEVVAQATLDIRNDVTYESPRLGNRFVYDQFAQATLVDRFTQFWRDFNTNTVSLLAQDPYLVQFAVTYFGTLNGALNPLGDQTAYTALKADVAIRNRAWTPGTPLLAIPVAPVVTYANDSAPGAGASGWSGINFDPNAFLARPDVQGQPIPVQMAMLRTNISYAALMQYQQQAVNAINDQINTANSLLALAQQLGFAVESVSVATVVPAGSPGVPVAFDQADFDLTGNVTNQTTFTIRATGEYTYAGTLNWEGTDSGELYTVTVLQNSVAILTESTDPSFTPPISQSFTGYGNFAEGDVVQVIASHSFSSTETVGAGSSFTMIQSGPAAPSLQVPSSATNNTKQFTADGSMSALTAFSIQPDGGIAPIDPTIVRGHLTAPITEVSVISDVLTVTCINSFTAGQTAFFYGLTGAAFLNGQSAVIVTASPTQFTANFAYTDSPPTDYPPTPETTGVANSGTVLFPFVDGATLTAVSAGGTAECGTTYGGAFQAAGASFTVGGLLYVGKGGILTQDYSSLITGSPDASVGPVQWIICVGRAMASDTFIYEPHLPQRIVSLS